MHISPYRLSTPAQAIRALARRGRLGRSGFFARCTSVAAVFALAACQEPVVPGPQDEARAEQLRPSSALLAEKYERSCMVCHTRVAAKAPLTGFAPDWQTRLKQGMDVLVQHAEQGVGSMPPRGQCADCTAQELRALVGFMAQEH